jgi:beta-glucuronidase
VRRLILAFTLLLAAPAAAAGPAGLEPLDQPWHVGKRTVHVPYQWNVHDDSVRSMRGGVRTYRTSFRLPDDGRWLIRFESVNLEATVWLNGRRIGRHRGAYLPFELPLTGAREGVNRLRVRVDNRRRRTDFPPSATAADGSPRGGWFNAGGVLRAVSVRPAPDVDLEQVTVLAEPGDIRVRARLRNYGASAATLPLTGRFGEQVFRSERVRVPPGSARTVVARVALDDPHLWSPEDPYLYSATARAGDATWRTRTGVRSIEVRGGRLFLNGKRLVLRGVGYHEDRPGRGMAITDADRRWLVEQAELVGANVMRTHYPPGEYLAELADRRGMLLWSEIPVWQMRSDVIARPAVRRRAVAMLKRNIEVNGSHPSVITWSIGNELNPTVNPGQRRYIRAALRAARRLDPGRPVSMAIFGYESALCQPALRALDILGVNEYYSWYYGRTSELAGYLDRLRRCYPGQALAVSEFGAEANRDGPVSEKGTYAFQRRFVADHLRIMASKPWLSGAIYWALNEFRVRPGWDGGNPEPDPPLHQKGLLHYDGKRKPAWYAARRGFQRLGR